MAQGSACAVNAIAQRLKRQSLQTPSTDHRLEESTVPTRADGSARGCPEHGFKPRAIRHKACKSGNKDPLDQGSYERRNFSVPVADENVGPDALPPARNPLMDFRPRGVKRDEISPPKLAAHLVPRPTHSVGLPTMSVRSFPPPARHSPASLDPVLRPHRSPPPAPPVKRFCRSLTEGLPRPTPLRPVPDGGLARGAASLDHLHGLVARRLRAMRQAGPGSGLSSGPAASADSLDSSFSSGRSSFRRWTGASTRSSSGYCGSSCDAEDEIRLPRQPAARRDYFHHGRAFLCGLPELQQRAGPSPLDVPDVRTPSPDLPAPSVRENGHSCPPPASPAPDKEKEEAKEDEDEDEEEETLMSDSRWSSPCGLADLDLDSMEKDDSWMP